MRNVFFMWMAVILLCACSSSKESKGGLPGLSLQGEWQVVSVYGAGVEEAETQPYISFQDSGKVAGNAGVNSFFGNYSSDGGASLTFNGMGMTRMMGSPASMAVEKSVNKALGEAASVKKSDDGIIVLNAKGETVMVLKRKL